MSYQLGGFLEILVNIKDFSGQPPKNCALSNKISVDFYFINIYNNTWI